MELANVFVDYFQMLLEVVGNPLVAVAIFAALTTLVYHVWTWNFLVYERLRTKMLPQIVDIALRSERELAEKSKADREKNSKAEIAKLEKMMRMHAPSCFMGLLTPIKIIMPLMGFFIYIAIAGLPNIDFSIIGLNLALVPLRNPIMDAIGINGYVLILWVAMLVVNITIINKAKVASVGRRRIIRGSLKAIVWLSLPLLYLYSRIFVEGLTFLARALVEWRARTKYAIISKTERVIEEEFQRLLGDAIAGEVKYDIQYNITLQKQRKYATWNEFASDETRPLAITGVALLFFDGPVLGRKSVDEGVTYEHASLNVIFAKREHSAEIKRLIEEYGKVYDVAIYRFCGEERKAVVREACEFFASLGDDMVAASRGMRISELDEETVDRLLRRFMQGQGYTKSIVRNEMPVSD